MTIETAITLKRYILDKLDRGIFKIEEWEWLMNQLKNNNFLCMLESLEKRFDHYKQIYQERT